MSRFVLEEFESSNTALSTLWFDGGDLVEDLTEINVLGTSVSFDSFGESKWSGSLWKANLDSLVTFTAFLLAVVCVLNVTGQEIVSDRLAVLSDSPVSIILWFVSTLVVDNLWINWNSWKLLLLSNSLTTSAAVFSWVVELR